MNKKTEPAPRDIPLQQRADFSGFRILLRLLAPVLLIGAVVLFSSISLPGQIRIYAHAQGARAAGIQGVSIYLDGIDTAETGSDGRRAILADPFPANHTLEFLHADYVTVKKTGIQVLPLGGTDLDIEMVPVLPGDINADGDVNAGDASLLSRFLLSGKTPSPAERDRADLAPQGSPDGQLNVADLLLLMNRL